MTEFEPKTYGDLKVRYRCVDYYLQWYLSGEILEEAEK